MRQTNNAPLRLFKNSQLFVGVWSRGKVDGLTIHRSKGRIN